MGFRMLNVGADVLALTDYFGRIAQAFKQQDESRRARGI
jgi:hypothetical protein